MKEKLFRVRWEIDLKAPTPTDAARLALKIQLDPESIATCFEVRRRHPDNTFGRKHPIDLTYGPGCEPEVETLTGREFCAPDNADAQAQAYSDAAEADQEARMMREGPCAPDNVNPAVNPLTRVVDGVTYKTVPEVNSCSCAGCVAQESKDLCWALDPEEVVCFHDNVIWAVSESKPEPEPEPKRGTVRDPDDVSEFLQCDDPVVDGVLYRAIDLHWERALGEMCEDCAGGWSGSDLCSDLPCCTAGRDDGRSVIWIEVKK